MNDEIRTTEATRTWMDVIAVLGAAADHGLGPCEARTHSLALQAREVAARAVALLPADLDRELDDVELPHELNGAGLADLVRAAERLTRRHPIEQLPAGASLVIVALGDLIAEAAA